MTRTIRLFLAYEAVTFLGGTLVHPGALADPFAYRKACIAESTIGGVLFWRTPPVHRRKPEVSPCPFTGYAAGR